MRVQTQVTSLGEEISGGAGKRMGEAGQGRSGMLNSRRFQEGKLWGVKYLSELASVYTPYQAATGWAPPPPCSRPPLGQVCKHQGGERHTEPVSGTLWPVQSCSVLWASAGLREWPCHLSPWGRTCFVYSCTRKTRGRGKKSYTSKMRFNQMMVKIPSRSKCLWFFKKGMSCFSYHW